MSGEQSRLSRRAFVRALGVAVGTCVAAPLQAGSTDALAHPVDEARVASLNIGVVLPQSRMLPTLGTSLLDGLRLAFGGTTVRLQPLWYAERPQAVQEHVKHLATHGVDVVVAAMSRNEAAVFGPLLAERGVPLIVADVGANMLRPKQAHPFIFRSSLNHWQAAWALGQWAALHGHRRALITSAFYDSGYDTIHAFWSGFERAGGESPALVVTHRPNGGDFGDVRAAIRETRPDVVFAAYSGRRATTFVQNYVEAGFGGLPLLGGGFLADDALLAMHGTAAGILSADSWASDLPAPAHRDFVSGYRTLAGVQADAFAALGYDTGRLIRAAGSHARPGTLRDALAAATTDGARGHVAFDAATLETRTPIYLRAVGRTSTGAAHVLADDLTTLAANPLDAPAGPRGGWKNAYLMV